MDSFLPIINTLSTTPKRITIKILKIEFGLSFFKVGLLQELARFGTIEFDWSEDLVKPHSLHMGCFVISK